ncbi:hypothetical protein HYX18_04265, partial [Candidatus Woesearchaeota archaeon]|nr:hypothetical protein [Candidatus Woesearchaeota archaeon]
PSGTACNSVSKNCESTSGCTSDSQCASKNCVNGQCAACTSTKCSPKICSPASGNCEDCTNDPTKCPSGTACNSVSKNCESTSGCTSDSQCASKNCVNGQCAACTSTKCSPKICSTSTGDCINCQDDSQCSPKKCKTSTGDCVECLTNTDCNGKICGNDNLCHTCGPSFQCPSGQSCNTISGNCELPTRDLSCTGNANCLSGEQCVNNRCTFVPPAAPAVTPVEAQPFPAYDWFNAIISLSLLLFYYARKKLNNL